MASEQKDPIPCPVESVDGLFFREGWFSGKNEHGEFDACTVIGGAYVHVTVKMTDGRKGSFMLGIGETVQALVGREFPVPGQASTQEDSDGE